MNTVHYAIAFLALAACTTPANYVQGNASTWCGRYQECNKGAFQSQYSDMADCIEEASEGTEEWAACAEEVGCEFAPDKVAECRGAMREGDCEEFVEGDWYNDCDEFWDCTDGEMVDVLECVADA